MAPLSATAQAAASQPPALDRSTASDPAVAPVAEVPSAPSAQPGEELPYPDALPIAPPASEVHIELQGKESVTGGLYTLDDHVVITYRDRALEADHMEYQSSTGDVTLTGHVVLTVGESDERISASHGSFNIRTGDGRFYDVAGSVGLHQKTSDGGVVTTQRAVYANNNPFLFTGGLVVRSGPRQFQIYNGTITSCQLPRPDWLLSGAEFAVDGDQARARNSVFHLAGLPVLWLPYVTHPVDTGNRQSGILIPELGINSSAKGETIGEQLYWAVNRSTDLTVGTIYYSARGWEQNATLRYRGLGPDFVRAHYSGLQDRGYYPGGVYVNQSGTDVVFSGRHDLTYDDGPTGPQQAPSVQARLVVDLEYLSSFPYREAFSSNFNQAVSSDVVSTVYATREWNGLALSLEGDRYQSEKRVANTTVKPPQVEQQVRIFHAPALEFASTDHRLGSTGLEWNLDSSAAALKRTQPDFVTSGMVERVDLHPELALPFGGGGWRVRPSLGGRETFYSRSRLAAVPGAAGPPVEATATLNRGDLDLQFDVRPPVLERTFDSGFLRHLLGHDLRHTIEPRIVYRYINGIGNFANTLRFDASDIASDTNEIEYGATQRLFLRRVGAATGSTQTPSVQTGSVQTGGRGPCRSAGSSADAAEVLRSAGRDDQAIEEPGQTPGLIENTPTECGSREWISWRVAQKYFFDPSFDGAVVENGPRSILSTTLDFSGISFLTGPREISPIVSRLRVRTSDKTDVEWDFDYDTCSSKISAATRANATLPCERKFTSNNVYADVHHGNITAGIIYARLNAPARSYVDGVLSAVADFDQMRVNAGYGSPTHSGFSALASAGIDIDLGTVQYGSILTSYNWNCCGVSIEYRKYELGTARNDNGYKFNFTLANIGSAGNIRHAGTTY